MSEPISRRPPLPQIYSFIACNEVFHDKRTGQHLIVGPVGGIPGRQFPLHVRLSLFVEFMGGHGTYQERFCLRDSAEEEVWGKTTQEPVEMNDPLTLTTRVLFDVMIAVPRPGPYTIVLQFNGEDLARRPIWFEAPRPLRA